MTDPSELDTLEFPLPIAGLERKDVASSSRVSLEVAARTDIGSVRETNEDHYLVARTGRHLETLSSNIPSGDLPGQFSETGHLLIVADGMGGAAGGEVASRMAIATLVNIVIHVPDWILKLDEEHAQKLMRRASKYYRQVNQALV
jgi:serine/threonine protein phosphatase PrpC